MSSAFLGDSLFVLLALSWTVYIVQEIFITGSSALSLPLHKNEAERRQIQVGSGLHWDGIEVWLIAALVLTEAGFPLVFSRSLTMLYVVFFLLLYALITRGVVIETIYKLDNPKWVKINGILWSISSVLIIFFIGIYITNIFYGLPFDDNGLTTSFLGVFTVPTVAGGLFFVALALTSGAAWIGLRTEGDLGDRALSMMKKYGIYIMIPVFLLFAYMGFNVLDNSIFIGELFGRYPVLFILPGLTFVFSMLTLLFGFKKNGKMVFLYSLLAMAFFLITGFTGTYPYVLPSRVLIDAGITIDEAIVSMKAAKTMFIIVVSLYPIVMGYQGWKYYRFRHKVPQGKEVE